uniref:FBA_2 domain-containing protein n=1 Tax=Caenorhabditis tropicalis TaxID=1561998 RepID=A0A1I7T4P7_9PELO
MVSKRKKIDNLLVHVDIYYRAIFFVEHSDSFNDMMFEQNRYVVGHRPGLPANTDIILFLQATQNFLDVTSYRISEFRFDLKPPFTVDQLIMTIDWLNEMKTDFRKVWIETETWEMLEIFLNRFRKNIHTLMLGGTDLKWDGTVKRRLNFEIKDLSSWIDCPWFHLDFLFNMEPETVFAEKIDISAQDLNVFLKSWQEGKTNKNLKKVDFHTCSEIDVKEVVKGCRGELMDPRTTKVRFSHEITGETWLRGGIHIRRNDGRLAVIDTHGFDYYSEGRDISEEGARRYLKNLEIWNSDDVWMGKVLYFYVI